MCVLSVRYYNICKPKKQAFKRKITVSLLPTPLMWAGWDVRLANRPINAVALTPPSAPSPVPSLPSPSRTTPSPLTTPFVFPSPDGLGRIFSSEYHDETRSLVYYRERARIFHAHYRHYNPIDGRWYGRDLTVNQLLKYLFSINKMMKTRFVWILKVAKCIFAWYTFHYSF